jgi:hypothetical protein
MKKPSVGCLLILLFVSAASAQSTKPTIGSLLKDGFDVVGTPVAYAFVLKKGPVLYYCITGTNMKTAA